MYLPLANKIARTHYNRFGEDDALQIAYYGLVRAAEKFDHTLGAFPSYAETWIKWSFQEAGIASTIVFVPTRMSKKMYSDYVSNTLSPGTTYVPFEILYMNSSCEINEQPVVEYEESAEEDLCARIAREALLDPPETPEEVFQEIEVWEKILDILSIMPEPQQEVIIGLYGLDGNPPETKIACGEKLKVHRNTIQEYQERAIDTLRLHLKF